MRALGIDLGTRRIGLAVSDPAARVAVPHGVLVRSADPEADRARIADVVVESGAEVVVVGLPVSLDGTHGPAAQAARTEAEALAVVLGVPVELHDERLTTVIASRAMAAAGHRSRARRERVDAEAAAVLLQSWLDSRIRQRMAGP
jgi:putative Holliday junction resolvase